MSLKGNALMFLGAKGKDKIVTRIIKSTKGFGELKNVSENKHSIYSIKKLKLKENPIFNGERVLEIELLRNIQSDIKRTPVKTHQLLCEIAKKIMQQKLLQKHGYFYKTKILQKN